MTKPIIGSSRVPTVPGGVYKVLVIPDLQVPYHDERSLNAVLKYARSEKWDQCILLGDTLDLDCISHHNRNRLRQVEGKRILADAHAGNQILDRIEKAVKVNSKSPKFVFLQGNHEQRITRLIEANPTLEGLVEVELILRLKERGWTWVSCWDDGQCYQLGKALFHHGRFHGLHHTRKHVLTYGSNVFYGHVHDMECSSLSRFGSDETIVGQSLGCLCKYEQSYLGSNPSKWQQGFGVFYFLPDGHFTYYTPRIFRNRFVAPNGKVYAG